jgi:hypothetical protein
MNSITLLEMIPKGSLDTKYKKQIHMPPKRTTRGYSEELAKTITVKGTQVQPLENTVMQALQKMTEVLQLLVGAST